MKRPPVLPRLLSQIFPRYCQLCFASSLDSPLPNVCKTCIPKLTRVGQAACDICHEPFDGALEYGFSCPNCNDMDFSFAYARSALRQTGEAMQLVHSYKYGKQICLARDLAAVMVTLIKDITQQEPEIKSWHLVPVPLHRRREGKRGFNQAAELCRFLTSAVDLPVVNALHRKRYTQTQTRLSRKQRQTNLKGAFALRKGIHFGKTSGLFLVDDVFTTGSTADACTAVLSKAQGVEKVIVLTAMRG